MGKLRTDIAAEELPRILRYDAQTGALYWIKHRGTRATAGSRADRPVPDGYRVVKIDGHVYRAHRVAWAIVNGVWPQDEIDHRNRRRDENELRNLREATKSQNAVNRPWRAGASGVKGVIPHGTRWRASIKFQGKRIHLGVYGSKEEAGRVHQRKAEDLFGDFAARAA